MCKVAPAPERNGSFAPFTNCSGKSLLTSAVQAMKSANKMSARIIFVEDEPGVLLVVSDLLRAEGHTVETERDGRSGLRRATEESFDLLILDVMLPASAASTARS